jgi:hypothetical protein
MKTDDTDRLDADRTNDAPPPKSPCGFWLGQPNMTVRARLRCHRDGEEATCTDCNPKEVA